MEEGGTSETPPPNIMIDEASSSPSPNPSLSSTPSLESTESQAVQTMARMRFLASQWKRRSLSGHGAFRSSQSLKSLFDSLDVDDHDPVQGHDLAREAEAIQREVQDNCSDGSLDESLTPSSSLPSSLDSLESSGSQGQGQGQEHQGKEQGGQPPPQQQQQQDKKGAQQQQQQQQDKGGLATSKSKRGSLFHRAKRALGISSEAEGAEVEPTKDHPVAIFNNCNSPGQAIDTLVTSGALEHTPVAVAEFFHVNDDLNKFKIGEYLGTLHDFNIKVLHELVKRFDFTKVDFDIALRHLLYCFRLPGEAQKINRIMDAFGSHFFNSCTNSVFVNSDAAQVMAFSSIMLTTDAHNPRVIEKMTKKQFVTLTRGMNGEGNFPKDFLEYMFEKVVDEPLIRIDHTTTLMPYATKRGWVYVPRRKSSWKRYYALLYEDTIYLQRKPLDSKWRKRITSVKMVSPEIQQIPNGPTANGVAITGVGEGVEVAYLAVGSHRDTQGWINVLP